jgi:hypothetical protein
VDDKAFLETWDIHNRTNLYLLDPVAPASLQLANVLKNNQPAVARHQNQNSGDDVPLD